MDIKTAIIFLFTIEEIKTKQDLDKWCKVMGKDKLYLYVQGLAPEHWNKIKTPKSSVRTYYQQILTGYKRYNITNS